MEEEKVLLQDRLAHPYSDKVIRERLYRDYHIVVSRRAVAKYRKELKIPASNRRGKEALLAKKT
jgi:DNA-directed RNA polymerase specialized sigma54-like protein